MVVTGTGIPLTLKLTKSGTAAATGVITVALLKLSPYPPQITLALLDSIPIPVTPDHRAYENKTDQIDGLFGPVFRPGSGWRNRRF